MLGVRSGLGSSNMQRKDSRRRRGMYASSGTAPILASLSAEALRDDSYIVARHLSARARRAASKAKSRR